jgi:hypothetical protein
LDYTIALLDRWPGSVPDFSLSPRPPRPDEPVFIIAYPDGGDTLAVTLEDNLAVEAGELEIGYQAPTTKGASGGLVMNDRWEALAIHRKADYRRRVNFGNRLDVILMNARDRLAEVKIEEALAERLRAQSKDHSGLPDEGYFSVFISYSRHDSAFANRLFNAFQANGVKAWLDREEVLPGEDIRDEIGRGIQQSDKIIICCSRHSLNSRWVESEIDGVLDKEYGLSRSASDKVLALIPVDLDGFLFEWDGHRATTLRARHAADFTDWQDDVAFEKTFLKLLEALRTDSV